MVFVVAEHEGEVVATSVIKKTPAIIWPDPDRPATYLSKLTSKRSFSRHRLGAALLAWSEQYSASLAKEFSRLDCWAENRRLCEFYVRAGYSEVGDAEAYDGFRLKLSEEAIDGRDRVGQIKGVGSL